ncbi:MAG: SlyX family protein [Pseudomonadota bacterium]
MSEIEHMQERIAHLLKTTDELSDVVARQEREIALLIHRVQMLMEREAEREADAPGGVVLGDERPPHY